MKLLVTGASGFLGRYVVAEALARGHAVRAMVRPRADVSTLSWSRDPTVEWIRADLRSKRGLVEAVAGVDAVLHLAAAKSGDIYQQLAGTVIATENLLSAMDEAGVRRIVAVSSLAVYDYLARRTWSLLAERSPLERRPEDRDEYCQAKTTQEQLIREHAERRGWACTVVRPGAIWGPNHEWTGRLGIQVGQRKWIRIGAWAPLPLTYVENCAEAIVICGQDDAAIGHTFNIVDDETPSQRRYAKLLQRRMRSPRKMIFPISWTAMRFVARLAWLINKLAFRGTAHMPSILVPARLHARCKPLRYSNRRLRDTLQWKPRYSLANALDRCFGANNDQLSTRDEGSAIAAVSTTISPDRATLMQAQK